MSSQGLWILTQHVIPPSSPISYELRGLNVGRGMVPRAARSSLSARRALTVAMLTTDRQCHVL
jgi:hypothetical protein